MMDASGIAAVVFVAAAFLWLTYLITRRGDR